MAYLHCQTQIQVPTRIRIPNLMATLYYVEYVHIARTQILIPFWIWISNHYCAHFWTDIRTRIGIRVRVRQCK